MLFLVDWKDLNWIIEVTLLEIIIQCFLLIIRGYYAKINSTDGL